MDVPLRRARQARRHLRASPRTSRPPRSTSLTLSNYSHLVEPRFDEIKSENEKLEELGKEQIAADAISLKPFRAALGTTPVIAAGGYNATNCYEGVEHGEHDLVAFGRYFCSNGDLVERLREGKPLLHYSEFSFTYRLGTELTRFPEDRERFYGPFPDNEIGYTVHPEQLAAKGQ